MGAMANNSTANSTAYAGWMEVSASTEKGRREIQYYLKRCGGGRDLVVVGKEKSAGHLSYRYTVKDNILALSNLNGASRLKLRSRQEVVDWLDSIVAGNKQPDNSRHLGGGMDRNLDDDVIEDVMRQKIGLYKTESTWLGSSWTCRKRRTHYQSFCRNGAVISAQEFVFVLAEEGKRLVAYLDDMYEDTRGNKMVVVRWFHKIDEVGFVLPHNYNDREIFFSLCLQDLSIECIDGLATVLSPEHYEKFVSEATHTVLMPFVCSKLFDNDDVKPFDITRVKGYWNQEIFRKSNRYVSEAVGLRPNKRICWSKESDLYNKSPENGEPVETSLKVADGSYLDCKRGVKKVRKNEHCSSVLKPDQYLAVGSEVEVLSQDSGIRGCWFRALILKKHKDKVKVQYKDLKDAVDDSKNLEEWILASRLAKPDGFGVRSSGRTIVRPNLPFEKRGLSGVIDVGTVVDVWWHDGWWEGIVVKKESEDRVHIYFSEEKKESAFSVGDVRHSKEWVNSEWQNIKQRLDVVSALCNSDKTPNVDKVYLPSSDDQSLVAPLTNNSLPQKVVKPFEPKLTLVDKRPAKPPVRDLTKDCLLAQLRWRSSGKRRRGRSPPDRSCVEFQTFEEFFVNKSLKIDSENCKSAGDAHFNSSVLNLVMSR